MRMCVGGGGVAAVQASASDLPHMLFYGPAGAGKKTRIMALLRAVFGPGVEKVRRCGCVASMGGDVGVARDDRRCGCWGRRVCRVEGLFSPLEQGTCGGALPC
jgi:DNA polymerase III delta prime subunit